MENGNALVLVSADGMAILRSIPNKYHFKNLRDAYESYSGVVADYQYLPSGKRYMLTNANRWVYNPKPAVIGSWEGDEFIGYPYDMHHGGINNAATYPKLLPKSIAIKGNELYVSRDDGMICIELPSGSISNVPAYNQKTAERMCFDDKGVLWACTSKGIVAFDGTNCTLYDKKTLGIAIPKDAEQMLCDKKGVVWIAAKNGLYRKTGDKWEVFTEKEGMPFTKIARMFSTGDRLYFIKSSGIFKPNKELAWMEGDQFGFVEMDVNFQDEWADFDENGRLWFWSTGPNLKDNKPELCSADQTGILSRLPRKEIAPLSLYQHIKSVAVSGDNVLILVNGYFGHPLESSRIQLQDPNQPAPALNTYIDFIKKCDEYLNGHLIITVNTK